MPMRRKRKRKSYKEVYALDKHISMSANKVRRVIDQIRGLSYEETLMILELMPYRACYPIFKLVYSAAANGRHNKKLIENYLIISKAEVNEGNTVKKFKPRARGRSFPIKRPTCHITIELTDLSFYGYEGYYENNFLYLKKHEWRNKNTNLTCHDRYGSGGLWDKK